MKRIAAIVIAIGVALPCLGETLTTGDVIRMAKAGLSAETIELKIRYSEAAFDTSTDALIALKEAGVSEATIRMMIVKQKSAPPAAAPSSTESPAGKREAETAVAEIPVTPTVAQPPAPATSPARAMFEVTARNPSTGAACSSAFLKIEQGGLAVTGCLGSNFTMKWPQIESVCVASGESTTIRLTTKSGVRELSAGSAGDRDEIHAAIVRGSAPTTRLETCKD